MWGQLKNDQDDLCVNVHFPLSHLFFLSLASADGMFSRQLGQKWESTWWADTGLWLQRSQSNFIYTSKTLCLSYFIIAALSNRINNEFIEGWDYDEEDVCISEKARCFRYMILLILTGLQRMSDYLWCQSTTAEPLNSLCLGVVSVSFLKNHENNQCAFWQWKCNLGFTN